MAWVYEISASRHAGRATPWQLRGARNAPVYDVAAKRMRELLPAGSLSKPRKSQNGDRFFRYRLPDLRGAAALQSCHRGGSMRDLTSVTPDTPRQVWCDGANAQICWARHTSHTSHPILRDRKKVKYTPPRHRGGGAQCAVWRELIEFAVTGVTGVTRPTNPGVSGATPLTWWHAVRVTRPLICEASCHALDECGG